MIAGDLVDRSDVIHWPNQSLEDGVEVKPPDGSEQIVENTRNDQKVRPDGD